MGLIPPPDTIFVNESNFTPFNFKWDSIFSQSVEGKGKRLPHKNV